jgi:pyruvate,orthophosphate dikinase
VVGCGRGALDGLAGRSVTVDGRTGKVYDGALAIEAPDESDYESLSTLASWAASRSPLRVLPPNAPEAGDAVDLTENVAAADPATIGEELKLIKGARGARGGAIASDEGVRAALAAGFEFIIADPVLPPLLAAVRVNPESATPSDSNERS